MGKEKRLDFIDRLKYLISSPNFFFEKLKQEHIGTGILTYIIISFVIALISLGINFGLNNLGFSKGYLGLSYILPIAIYIFIYVFGFISTFIYSAFVHILAISFKGKGNYTNSYNVYAFSMIPLLIVPAIPIIGMVLFIPTLAYVFVLMILGIAKTHEISYGYSALACLLPIIFLIGLLFIFILSLFHLSSIY